MSKKNIIHKAGKRKTAIAKATLKAGKGQVRVNHLAVDAITPKLYRMKVQEAVILAGDVAKEVDIDVTVRGGGINAQAEAVRTAIARCLSDYSTGLKQVFLDYDRSFIVPDVRLKEQHKPNRHGTARGKKQKSYR